MKMFLFSFLVIVCATGCNNQRDADASGVIGGMNDVREDDIYFDYRITANEGDDNLTIFLRFTLGEDGETLVITEPASVELDGEKLRVDSANRTGAFYEIQKPIAGFEGKHRISFTGFEKKYSEEFFFEPMRLMTYIPDTISREDLNLELAGVSDEDYVRVIVMDTAFHHDGINRLDTLVDGKLSLTKMDLRKLSNGPIHLELHRESEKDVDNGTFTGGRIYITYSLKRDLFLKD